MVKNRFAGRALPGGFPSLALQFIIPVAFFCLIFLFYPFRGVFMFDPDEGIELAKAQLLLRGYRMYDEIWSDQPPLLNHLLSIVLRLFGLKVNVGRVLVLLLVCALIWAFFRFIQSAWGDLHAVAGALLLVLLPEFPKLSVAVMGGLPAIAFAVVSLYFLARWHQRRRVHFLILSAFLLALSVLTKLFTGFLAPIFIAGVLIDEVARRRASSAWKETIIPAALWSLVFGLSILVLGWILVKPHNLSQILDVHLSARSVAAFTGNQTLTLAWQLKNARVILILAVPGLVYTLISKRWLFLYPASWMLAAGVLLLRHHPVWYHQQLLVTVPAAYLAAVACGEVAQDFRKLWKRGFQLNLRALFSIFTLSLLVLMLFVRLPATLAQFNPRPSFKSPGLKETSEEVYLLNQMSKYASQTNWVVTNKPIYAFWARLPVTPPLVVFTDKRLSTGELSGDQVLDVIQEYQPEQVLFIYYMDAQVEQYLRANYQQIYSRNLNRLYVRNDIALNQPP